MLIAVTHSVSELSGVHGLMHPGTEPIDWGLAAEQHAAYEAMLRSLGCRIERLPGEPVSMEGGFLESQAVVFPELAVLTRPDAPGQQSGGAVARALCKHRLLVQIAPPGRLDGADVLRMGRRVFVGEAGSTNPQGIRQLMEAIEPYGYTVQSVPVRDGLHLNRAVTALNEDRVLLNPAWVDKRLFTPFDPIEVDPKEPFAANTLCIAETILYEANFRRTRARLESHQYDVRPIDMGELGKAGSVLSSCSLVFTDAACSAPQEPGSANGTGSRDTRMILINCGSNNLSALEDAFRPWVADCQIVSLANAHEIDFGRVDFVAISGSPRLFTDPVEGAGYAAEFGFLQQVTCPVLGICAGHQGIALFHGARIHRGAPQKGMFPVHFSKTHRLLEGIPSGALFTESHCEAVTLPDGFELAGSSDACPVEIIVSPRLRRVGVQFHPELSGIAGERLIANYFAWVQKMAHTCPRIP